MPKFVIHTNDPKPQWVRSREFSTLTAMRAAKHPFLNLALLSQYLCENPAVCAIQVETPDFRFRITAEQDPHDT